MIDTLINGKSLSNINYEDKTFKTFKALKKAIETECTFWEEMTNGLLRTTRHKYITLRNELERLEGMDLENSTQLANARNMLSNAFNSFNNSNPKFCFWSTNEISVKMKDLNIENFQVADGFIKMYFSYGTIAQNINEQRGALHAVLYDTKITNVINTSSAKRSYEKLLSDTNKLLDEQIFQHNEILQKNSDNVEQHKKMINKWASETQTEFNDFLKDKKERLGSLEETYNEKLKLSAPANYWAKMRKKYRIEGGIWLGLTVVMSIIIALTLNNILIKGTVFNVEFMDDIVGNLSNTLLLAVLVSTLIYVLRLFVKLAMSALHLARDAEERTQLSYFYLALLEETDLEQSEKHIAIQSLFSRSDTGLLKGDSSPSFPLDNLMGHVINNIKK